MGTFEYNAETVERLSSILKQGEYDQIKELPKAKDLSGEDLTVIRFKDERGNQYYGLVYDSIELFQDPHVFEIFSAARKSIRNGKC